MTTSVKKWLAGILLTLCLIFIWGNSLLPAQQSGAVSGGLSHLLSLLFGAWAIQGEWLLRKVAHFSEFALLGVLLGWNESLHRKKRTTLSPLLALMIAMLDETLQLISPGRASMVLDVWLDFAGSLTGLGCLALLSRITFKKLQKMRTQAE